MKICLDLDGVICSLKQSNETYMDVVPLPGAADTIRSLRKAGHYIIIQTARHMKTCDGNVGKVIAKQGKTTLDWLEKHEIEYDEIFFGKPWAQVYIDDNAMRFSSWENILSDGSSLPQSSESKISSVT